MDTDGDIGTDIDDMEVDIEIDKDDTVMDMAIPTDVVAIDLLQNKVQTLTWPTKLFIPYSGLPLQAHPISLAFYSNHCSYLKLFLSIL